MTVIPDAALARDIVLTATGRTPIRIERFVTGSHHYVFDIGFAAGPPLVARLTRASEGRAMQGAYDLSRLLRPLGVPLPELLAHDLTAACPWLLLERLAGSDLAQSIATLSDIQLDAIAGGVARAQAITAGTPSNGRYGYAARTEEAPHAAWSQVLADNLDRSRQRIAAARLFEATAVDAVYAAMLGLRQRIDAVSPTPFLRDTTTKNVIVSDAGTLSGIVDVDDLCFGDPRYPAALTQAVLLSRGLSTRYVEAWRQHAGWADDEVFRLYVALFLLDLMGEHGQVFNGNEQTSDPEARQVLSAALRAQLEAMPG